MILLYYRDLRRRIERLEAQRLPKPEVTFYLEAVDENGKPWNIVGPDYCWLKDENNPDDIPPPLPALGAPPVFQSPADPDGQVHGLDAPNPAAQLAHDHPAANLPSLGHNQGPISRSRSQAASGDTRQGTGLDQTPG